MADFEQPADPEIQTAVDTLSNTVAELPTLEREDAITTLFNAVSTYARGLTRSDDRNVSKFAQEYLFLRQLDQVPPGYFGLVTDDTKESFFHVLNCLNVPKDLYQKVLNQFAPHLNDRTSSESSVADTYFTPFVTAYEPNTSTKFFLVAGVMLLTNIADTTDGNDAVGFTVAHTMSKMTDMFQIAVHVAQDKVELQSLHKIFDTIEERAFLRATYTARLYNGLVVSDMDMKLPELADYYVNSGLDNN